MVNRTALSNRLQTFTAALGLTRQPGVAPQEPWAKALEVKPAKVDLGGSLASNRYDAASGATNQLSGQSATIAHVAQRDVGYEAGPVKLTRAETLERLAKAARANGVDALQVKKMLESDPLALGVLGPKGLKGADLRGADLRGMKTDCFDGKHVELVGVKLAGADLTDALIQQPLPGVDLSGCNLTRARLLGHDLTGAKLDGAKLTGAEVWSDLRGVSARGADFTAARLRGNLVDADLEGAVFDRAELDVDFTGANLKGARMRGATIGNRVSFAATNLNGAMIEGLTVKGAADFAGADARNATLSIDVDSPQKRSIDFAATKLDGARITLSSKYGAESRDAIVAALSRADLSKATVHEDTLRHARSLPKSARAAASLTELHRVAKGAAGEVRLDGEALLSVDLSRGAHAPDVKIPVVPEGWHFIERALGGVHPETHLYRPGDVRQGENERVLAVRLQHTPEGTVISGDASITAVAEQARPASGELIISGRARSGASPDVRSSTLIDNQTLRVKFFAALDDAVVLRWSGELDGRLPPNATLFVERIGSETKKPKLERHLDFDLGAIKDHARQKFGTREGKVRLYVLEAQQHHTLVL
ncbi:MAG: pentapeptide repeat-containing protein [Myxococcaceae bacterium]|nr:pentapeptide repeat-containing protein [Myxococcaceae bacterium]